MAQITFAAVSQAQSAYVLDDGELQRPAGYREWVYVGSPLTPNDMNNGKAAFPEHHNVYIDPKSWEYWKTRVSFAMALSSLKNWCRWVQKRQWAAMVILWATSLVWKPLLRVKKTSQMSLVTGLIIAFLLLTINLLRKVLSHFQPRLVMLVITPQQQMILSSLSTIQY